jgi:hypothetical protein
MVYESARDAIFSIRYDKTPDRFTIENTDEMPAFDAVRVELGSNDDFILFDNDTPGAFRFATHSGQNKLAATTLALTVFDEEYLLFSESMRDGAQIYELETRMATAAASYSNRRRLARIALHAGAPGASTEVKELHARINAASGDDGGEGLRLSDELNDGQPAGVPAQVQPDF